jgi:two-component system OmpR family sensor kinase
LKGDTRVITPENSHAAQRDIARLRAVAAANEAGDGGPPGPLAAELRAIADRLETALREAEATEDQLRRFVAEASHEMRIPLTVIRGEAELLLRRDGGDDPERCAALAAIDEEANRLGRMLDDLLTLNYRPDRLHVTLEPVDIGVFLSEFVERYADAWPQRTIQIENSLPPGTPLLADRDALTRVLINLVENATRYSRQDGAIVLAIHEEDGCVAVDVRDEGPGMSREDAERVFERFYRGAAGRDHERRGTGLGLSIVRALIQAGGGSVRLDTAPDRGTTVTLLLPSARNWPL